MLEVKEHEIVTDFMEYGERNDYIWTHVTSKPMVVDIHVLDGSLEARLTDGRKYSEVKFSSGEQKLIHFYVEPEVKSGLPQGSVKDTSMVSAFDFSRTFKNFVLELDNRGDNTSCSYNLVYSSGASKIYLQDGLITDITLDKSQPTTFLYYKDSK
jgi:hypothetical protein